MHVYYVFLDFIGDANLRVRHPIQCKIHLLIHGPKPPEHSLALQSLKFWDKIINQNAIFWSAHGTD